MKYNYLSYSFNYIKIEVKIIVYCFFQIMYYLCYLLYMYFDLLQN